MKVISAESVAAAAAQSETAVKAETAAAETVGRAVEEGSVSGEVVYALQWDALVAAVYLCDQARSDSLVSSSSMHTGAAPSLSSSSTSFSMFALN